MSDIIISIQTLGIIMYRELYSKKLGKEKKGHRRDIWRVRKEHNGRMVSKNWLHYSHDTV